jgi:hypothetical protein
MRVQDHKGDEIKVGSKVLYGDPSPEEQQADYVCEVTGISEPDVVYNPETDADDGGYEVMITVRFKDGEEDVLHAPLVSQHGGPYDYDHIPEEEVFEEGGDIEVISNGWNYDQHSIDVSEDGIWNFQETLKNGSKRTFFRVTITEIVTQSDGEQPSCDIAVEVLNAPTKEQTVESGNYRVFFSMD